MGFFYGLSTNMSSVTWTCWSRVSLLWNQETYATSKFSCNSKFYTELFFHFNLWPDSIKRMYRLQRKTWNCISTSICIFQREFCREVYLYKSNRNKFQFSEFHRNEFYLHIWLRNMANGHYSLYTQQHSMKTVLKTFVF